MKVIAVDNYDRSIVPDKLIAGPGLSKQDAKTIASALNGSYPSHIHEWFYRAVEDDYKLFKPEE